MPRTSPVIKSIWGCHHGDRGKVDNFVGGFYTYLKQVVQWLCGAKELSQQKCVRGRVTEAQSELCSFHKVNSRAVREARPGAVAC